MNSNSGNTPRRVQQQCRPDRDTRTSRTDSTAAVNADKVQLSTTAASSTAAKPSTEASTSRDSDKNLQTSAGYSGGGFSLNGALSTWFKNVKAFDRWTGGYEPTTDGCKGGCKICQPADSRGNKRQCICGEDKSSSGNVSNVSALERSVSIDVDLLHLESIPLKKENTEKLHLSFSGSGFLGIYHLGAAHCLIKHAAHFLDGHVERIGGASGGSLVAALLVVARNKVEESSTFTYDLAATVSKKPLGALTPGYNLLDDVRAYLEKLCPHDAHFIATERLFVSLTNVKTNKNEIIHRFDTREELIQCLLGSCYIPVYAGLSMPVYKSQRYMDGGITNNLPSWPGKGRTIFCSPFSGRITDICPVGDPTDFHLQLSGQSVSMSLDNIKRGAQALFPPDRDQLNIYYRAGYKDCINFLVRDEWIEIVYPD